MSSAERKHQVEMKQKAFEDSKKSLQPHVQEARKIRRSNSDSDKCSSSGKSGSSIDPSLITGSNSAASTASNCRVGQAASSAANCRTGQASRGNTGSLDLSEPIRSVRYREGCPELGASHVIFTSDYSSSMYDEDESTEIRSQSTLSNRIIATDVHKQKNQAMEFDDSVPQERETLSEENRPVKDRLTWSVGSKLHDIGECKPCAWHWKSVGCSKGADCNFCHTCAAGAYLMQRKDRVTRIKVERFLRRAEKPGSFYTNLSL